MQPWGKVIVRYQGMHTTIFELFCKYKTSSTWEELMANYSMLSTSMETSDWLEPEG